MDLTVDYAYDSVGNRTFMRVTEPARVAEVAYEYNERDQLLRETRSGTTATGELIAYRTGPGPDAATAYRVRRPASFASAAAAAFGLCWLAAFSLAASLSATTGGEAVVDYEYDANGAVIATHQADIHPTGPNASWLRAGEPNDACPAPSDPNDIQAEAADPIRVDPNSAPLPTTFEYDADGTIIAEYRGDFRPTQHSPPPIYQFKYDREGRVRPSDPNESPDNAPPAPLMPSRPPELARGRDQLSLMIVDPKDPTRRRKISPKASARELLVPIARGGEIVYGDPKTWCRFPILSGGFGRELRELCEPEAGSRS